MDPKLSLKKKKKTYYKKEKEIDFIDIPRISAYLYICFLQVFMLKIKFSYIYFFNLPYCDFFLYHYFVKELWPLEVSHVNERWHFIYNCEWVTKTIFCGWYFVANHLILSYRPPLFFLSWDHYNKKIIFFKCKCFCKFHTIRVVC